jgi:hypothetical protein
MYRVIPSISHVKIVYLLMWRREDCLAGENRLRCGTQRAEDIWVECRPAEESTAVWRCVVSVTTAHKILISAAVLFFFGYALWELRQYSRLGGVGALLRSGGALVVAVSFGVYLRSFVRSLRK